MACCAIIVALLSLYMATGEYKLMAWINYRVEMIGFGPRSIKLSSLPSAANGQVATITSTLPAGFFTASSAVNIATASVVQLFCTADSSDAVFTWDRGGTVLTNDPPRTRIRSNSDASSTTSILTVDDFQAADSGVYQCSAGGATATTQMLTGDHVYMFVYMHVHSVIVTLLLNL